MSILFAFISLNRVYTVWVYTVCHSQSEQRLHCLPFSAVWSGSTLFHILSSLIRVYTIRHSKFDQGLHYLPFSAVWSVSTLFEILSKQYYQGLYCLPFSAVWSGSTFFFHYQSYQGLHCLLLSVWTESTLFAILNSMIRVYPTCLSQQSDQGQSLHCHSHEQSWSGSTLLPFSAVWLGSKLFAIHNLVWVYTICHFF